jgi:hypothetical protein
VIEAPNRAPVVLDPVRGAEPARRRVEFLYQRDVRIGVGEPQRVAAELGRPVPVIEKFGDRRSVNLDELVEALLPYALRAVVRSCGGRFEIRNGIPVLYPKHVEAAHLAEEEKLGEIMKRPSPSGKEFLSENQWIESKDEFWGYVINALGEGPPLTTAYIGSGIDTRFFELQERGHTVVAFDLTFHLLDTLRAEHGAWYNVAGAVETLPFKKRAFDALCCIDLIHHDYVTVPRILGSFE